MVCRDLRSRDASCPVRGADLPEGMIYGLPHMITGDAEKRRKQ